MGGREGEEEEAELTMKSHGLIEEVHTHTHTHRALRLTLHPVYGVPYTTHHTQFLAGGGTSRILGTGLLAACMHS